MLVVKQYIFNFGVLIFSIAMTVAIISKVGVLVPGNLIVVAALVIVFVALARSAWYVSYGIDGESLVVKRWYIGSGTREYRAELSSISALWDGVDPRRRPRFARRLYVVMDDKAIFIGAYNRKRRKWLEENLGKEVEEAGHVFFMVNGLDMQVGKLGVIVQRGNMSYKKAMEEALSLREKSNDLTE